MTAKLAAIFAAATLLLVATTSSAFAEKPPYNFEKPLEKIRDKNHQPRPRFRVRAKTTSTPVNTSTKSSMTEKLAQARDNLNFEEDEGISAILDALSSTTTTSQPNTTTARIPAFVLPPLAEKPVALPQRWPADQQSLDIPDFLTRNTPRFVNDPRRGASIMNDNMFNSKPMENVMMPRTGGPYKPPQNIRERPRAQVSIPLSSSAVSPKAKSPYDRSQLIPTSKPVSPSSNKPTPQPYKSRFDDDYYYYDYDYEYDDKPNRKVSTYRDSFYALSPHGDLAYKKPRNPPLVTKARLPTSNKKSPSYPTYKKQPSKER